MQRFLSANDMAVERGHRRKKKAQCDDLLVERKQHNQKKAQRMKSPRSLSRGLFLRGVEVEISIFV